MKNPFIYLLSLNLISSSLWATPLLPDTFLEQVKNQNEGIRGAQESEKGAKLRIEEGGLIFSPTFFANAQVIDDQKPTASVASQGDETKLKVGELGISQVTRLGLSGKLSYGLTDTTILHTSRAYLPRPSFTDSTLKFELNQPLWQNSFGKQFQHIENATIAQINATALSKRYETQLFLFDAEARYWKLSSIRENIKILKTNLERTNKIFEFNKTKFKRNLTDETDMLQAQAQVKSRALDLKTAQNEEKEAMRSLNASRNINADIVQEELSFPTFEEILNKLEKLPQPANFRNDVLASEQAMTAVKESQAISQDKTLPDLNLFAVGALYSRELTTQDALDKSFDSAHPYYAVGVRFSLPLDFAARNQIRQGYAQETLGTELSYRKKKFDQESEWQILNTKIQLTKERLILAKELKEAQYIKLENERQRQVNGRSTTFQVFSFEQEYLAAQLNLVQLQTNAMMLLAQAKTFRDLD